MSADRLPGPLRRIDPGQRQQLLDDLNYLNMREVRVLCERLGIPYRILVETRDGMTKVTKDTDRKPIILSRVRHYLMWGEVPAATRIPDRIVREGAPPERLRPTDRLYYHWYDKTNPAVMGLLADLTNGRFGTVHSRASSSRSSGPVAAHQRSWSLPMPGSRRQMNHVSC